MRMSSLFSQTLRESPSEAQSAGYAFLLRAGFIRQVAAGIFTLLPPARRTIQKIEAILRSEMNTIGGQEVSMPVVLPADLWKETGRWYSIGAEMGRFRDRNERDLALAMTHEEAVGDLVRREIRSYKQLPQLIYHLQTKFRDDPRPRAGLIRVREFTMKDSYSLDRGWEGLDQQYRAHYQAYFNIFNRCGLPVIAVKSDTGMMGGKLAHEFMFLNPIGEDTLLLCTECGYSANRQIAGFRKQPCPPEPLLDLEPVATPGAKTIETLANLLDIPTSKTAKAVFMTATLAEGERLVTAILRGDMEVNETKLANAVHAREMRPAEESEILAAGGVPGYASPIGMHGALVVVDDLIPLTPNLVAGANLMDTHFRNVNYGRDYQADFVTDICAARAGDLCPECGALLRAERGVEVGNIFKLGTWYSEAMGCSYQDENDAQQPVVMGSYGIGVGRLLGCIAEAHNDGSGLIWPVTVAPWQVHLVLLRAKGSITPEETAESLYTDLTQVGIEVLYDDREESPGVKFNDADLIGVPLRITISGRGMDNGTAEFKRRDCVERELVPLDHAITRCIEIITELEHEILQRVTPVEFHE